MTSLPRANRRQASGGFDPNASTIQGAVAMAMDRGWSVFPVRGKVPATPHGYKDATRDFDQIERLWPKGSGLGIGLATGKISGIWVLDLDGEAGISAFKALQEKHSPIPPTVTARTRRGFHLYFRVLRERGQ